MSRREFLEKVIVGTLLESTDDCNYFDDCRCIVTPDMIHDDTNRRIYGIVSEMNKNGIVDTTPYNIFQTYGAGVLDIVAYMAELLADYSFIHLKTQYNERLYVWCCKNDKEYKRTDVQFNDYVRQFVQITLS